MARFDFVSPGAAFTDAVTDFLTKKKAEERQQLLDSLAVNADRRAAEAATLEAKEANQRMATQQDMNERARVAEISQYLDPNDPAALQGLSPEDRALMQKHGAIRDIPNSSTVASQPITGSPLTPALPATGTGKPSTPPLRDVGSIIMGAMQPGRPTQQGFVGNQAQRDLLRQRQATGSFINGLMTNPDTKQAGTMFGALAQIHNGILPDSSDVAIMHELGPKKQFAIFDENSKKITTPDGKSITDYDPSKYTLITRGFMPPGYANSFMDRYVGTNEDGYPVFMGKDGKLHVDTTAGRFKTPANTMAGALTAPILDDLNTKATMLMQNPSDKDAIDSYRSSATYAAAQMTVRNTPTVKQIINEIIMNPRQGNALFAKALDSGEISKNDANVISSVVSSVLPPNIVDILKLSPYTGPKVKTPIIQRLQNLFSGDNSNESPVKGEPKIKVVGQ